MMLRSVYLYLNLDEYPDSLSGPFGFQTRYICNFLQRRVRSQRFRTEGFNAICIEGREHPRDECRLQPENAAVPEVYFDRQRYEALREEEYSEFFLSMLLEGLRKCSEHHVIPLDFILATIEEFRAGGYKNQWVHQSKLFRPHGVRVELQCELTIDEFTLTFVMKKRGELVLEERILRTKPDEIIFHYRFKEVKLLDGNLVVLDLFGKPLYSTPLPG